MEMILNDEIFLSSSAHKNTQQTVLFCWHKNRQRDAFFKSHKSLYTKKRIRRNINNNTRCQKRCGGELSRELKKVTFHRLRQKIGGEGEDEENTPNMLKNFKLDHINVM